MKVVGRLLVGLVPMALASCGGGGDRYYPGYPTPPSGTYANLQIVAASLDAPPIDVILDDQPFVTHLDYGQGTGERPITPTSHTLVVQIETPGGPTTIIGPTTLDAAVNMDYVLAVEGNVGSMQSPRVSLSTFPHKLAVVPAQSARIQVLNAYDASIFVSLTAPGADFGSGMPLSIVPFGSSVGPMEVSAGEWELWISVSDSPFGPVDLGPINLEGGMALVYSVLPTFYGTDEPITYQPCCSFWVSALDAFGNNSWLNRPAKLRVIHDSPDASALAVTANGKLTTPVVATLAYKGFSYYLEEMPGAYDLAITPASKLSDVLASQAIDLGGGTNYSLYALGPLAQIFPFITRDDDRGYATQARLRFVQGSPSAQAVDVYLTAAGVGISSATPTYAAMPFATDTGLVSYVDGSYDLTVTLAGSKTPIIGPVPVRLNNGGVYTAVARDTQGGGAPYGLIEPDNLLGSE